MPFGDGQLSLFPDDDTPVHSAGRTAAAAVAESVATLASQLRSVAPTLRLGTSSWTFPGWSSLIYAPTRKGAPSESLLRRDGLRAYAAHPLLRTVGVDRSFYAPLPASAWATFAAMTPPDFRFLVKADRAITSPTEHTGGPNRLYLDADHAISRVLAPTVEGLGERLGVIAIQFPPLRLGVLGGVRGFLEGLAPFLHRLDAWRRSQPVRFSVAIELRNVEPYAEDHAPTLRSLLAASDVRLIHCHHPAAPPLDVQRSLFPPESQAETIVRWMLRRNHQYEEAADRYRPFDRLVEPDAETRRAIAALVRDTQSIGRPAWVIANNKAEGCSPLTLTELARSVLGEP